MLMKAKKESGDFVPGGADDQEHATPILSLCHGIITD